MQPPFDPQRLQADIRMPWLSVAAAVLVSIALVLVCQHFGDSIQQPLPDTTREWLRTALYATAIVTFPFTNLLRHIQLRLNQTMPCPSDAYPATAKRRYWVTVTVSMALIQSPVIYGFVMFYFGDPVNTLTIFTLMSALGFYLYRPKPQEYQALMTALARQHHDE
ncbi:hypothetical protein [Methylovulum psychrotolerans]|uniref:Uncharacterized protein n=1 Tax=Methylovulum psychrotolerans TaxID=1704499 RepID=A0A1Z4BY40_9GAMM|nr:hypothetical protein [Methylovulum psychrotolerans]ASF46169.1 hypothetical protein CEK71_08780 [Methylovulum psychrotolerans]